MEHWGLLKEPDENKVKPPNLVPGTNAWKRPMYMAVTVPDAIMSRQDRVRQSKHLVIARALPTRISGLRHGLLL